MTSSPVDLDTNEYLNPYKIVHIHNKSNTYHLTRQMLLDSAMQISLTQNTYSFFYHILSKDTSDFNNTYGSFAYIDSNLDSDSSTRTYHANLYVNVDATALDCIIEYVQKRTINKKINTFDDINQLVDLATMFAMPDLVEQLRKKIPSESYICATELLFKRIAKLICVGILHKNNIVYPEDKIDSTIDNFFSQNTDLFSTYIINLYNNEQLWLELVRICVQFYSTISNPKSNSDSDSNPQ